MKKPDSQGPITMVMEVYRKNENKPITIVPNDFTKPE
jgi:hypothetical protein